MTENKVAIVGAGLAGLCAARLSHAAGIDFVLIEARERLGGRILTVDAAGAPCEDGFDLGPSWFWPRAQPAIGDLVAELGLSGFSQHGEGDVAFERMSREPWRRYRAVEQNPHCMRLVGGSAALVRALSQDLPRDKIMLGARVTAMTLHENGVELAIARADGASDRLAAAHAIAALPPRLLEATVAFTPAQEPEASRRWRGAPTWMASCAKFFAVYERPFWRDIGLCGTAQSMVGPMAEMHDATTASGRAALFGFLGVAAEQRAALGEEKLARACLDQFARIFGEEARAPIATIFKDWAADPLTATAEDRAAAGCAVPGDAPWVLGAWRRRLALASSETSPSEPGYLAGAVAAAQRAFAEVLSKLNAGKNA